MQVLFTKANHPHQTINAEKQRRVAGYQSRPSKRPMTWTPQPSGLSRDETRELVLEMIG